MQQKINYKLLGISIKESRLREKITQDSLAEIVGCSPTHIANIENAYTKPSLNMLLAIADALDTSIDSLISNQYKNPNTALDLEIARAVAKCDIEMKERILRIINVL